MGLFMFVHMKKSAAEKPIGGLEGPGTLAHVNSVCAWNTFDKPKTFQKIAFFVYVYIYIISYPIYPYYFFQRFVMMQTKVINL